MLELADTFTLALRADGHDYRIFLLLLLLLFSIWYDFNFFPLFLVSKSISSCILFFNVLFRHLPRSSLTSSLSPSGSLSERISLSSLSSSSMLLFSIFFYIYEIMPSLVTPSSFMVNLESASMTKMLCMRLLAIDL